MYDRDALDGKTCSTKEKDYLIWKVSTVLKFDKVEVEDFLKSI